MLYEKGEEEETDEEKKVLYQEVLGLGQGLQDLVCNSIRQAGGHVQLYLAAHTHRQTKVRRSHWKLGQQEYTYSVYGGRGGGGPDLVEEVHPSLLQQAAADEALRNLHPGHSDLQQLLAKVTATAPVAPHHVGAQGLGRIQHGAQHGLRSEGKGEILSPTMWPVLRTCLRTGQVQVVLQPLLHLFHLDKHLSMAAAT